MALMQVRRYGAAVAAVAAASAIVGCAAGGDATGGGSSAGSCADVVVLDGIRYIGGRGGDGMPLPAPTGPGLRASTAPCADGDPAVRWVQVRAIRRVALSDAVVATDPARILLSERLWSEPRAALPPAVRALVHADATP